MLTYSTLTSIFVQIANRHNPTDKAFQLNCFAVIDKESDFNDNSFGKSIEDAKEARYWTREGITENNNANEFPALIMMLESTKVSDNQIEYNVLIGVSMLEDCCKTIDEVEVKAETVLISVINEFYNYSAYKPKIENTLPILWHYISDPTIDTNNYFKSTNGSASVLSKDLTITLSKDLSDKKMRMKATRLTFVGCLPELDSFGDPKEYKYLTTPKCTNCF